MTVEHVHPDGAFATERQSRARAFGAVAERLQGKRIALYGSGANAKDVLEAYGSGLDPIVVGGRRPTAEHVTGHETMSWGEALAAGLDAVVIAANTRSTYEVYARIRDDCRFRQPEPLPVYDLYGNDLEQLFSLAGQVLAPEALSSTIARYEVVSFSSVELASALGRDSAGHGAVREVFAHALEAARANGALVVALDCGDGLVLDDPNRFVDLVVSGRERYITWDNGIYRELREAFPGRAIAHLGIDFYHDVYAARVHGIEGFLLEDASGPEPWKQDDPVADGVVLFPQGEAERAAAELVADARMDASAAWRLGYRALGPLVAGFVQWLAQEVSPVRQPGFDGVLFAARDAYLLWRAYERYRPRLGGDLPTGTYLRISRKAALRPLLDNPAAFPYVAREYAGMTAEEMLRDLTGGHVEALPAQASLADALLDAAPQLADAALVARERTLRSFERSGLASDGRYAFVETWARGNCQRMISEYAPFALEGRYLSHRAGDPRCDEGIIGSYVDGSSGYLPLRAMNVEALFSAPESSVSGFDSAGAPLLGEDARGDDDLVTIADAQSGALAFCDDLFALLEAAGCGTRWSIRPEYAEQFLRDNDDLSVEVETDNSISGMRVRDPIYEHPSAAARLAGPKAVPAVGFTAGVFDLLHQGHINLFERARARCGFLRVGVISDEISAVLKRKVPIVPLEQRMEAIAALDCVDEVVPIREERLLSKVEAWYEWGFDVAFSGDDHADDPGWQCEERVLAGLGARIEYLPYTKGISSTMLRERLDRASGDGDGGSR